MDSKTPNSVFFLELEGGTGVVNLIHALPNQRLFLKQVSVTFTNQAASETNGSLLNASLSFFSHVRINSNRKRQVDSLPIMNDVSKRVTHYGPDIEIDTDSSAVQSFEYTVFRRDGTIVTDMTSLQLLFAYEDTAIF